MISERREARTILPVGDRVVYPSHGPCSISQISTQVVGGCAVQFYHLVFAEDERAGVLGPVEKADAIGVRALLKRSQIPKLLGQLASDTGTGGDWKQRAAANRKLLTSGSAFDLASVVSSLTAVSDSQTLSPSERQTLDRARTLLILEVAEVLGETRTAAEKRIDRALGGRH
jgi:RNA polymerase-interacting CarD/CdnL/TRCF family regulator